MAEIITAIKTIAAAVAAVFQWMNERRLVLFGRLQERTERLEEARRNEAIASRIDSQPVPDSLDEILDGLRRPE